jgi:hypothetical protein
MGMPCFVFHHIHPMVGLDLENSIIPPAPAVIPYIPYASVTILSGNFFSPKFTQKTYALMQGIRIMQKGTDCGYLGVPHFGNPANALYPLILGMSKSKSHFGVATVKVEGTAVATAIAFVGINLNCGTISTPTGFVIPPTTVFAGMTLGDFIAGVFNIAVDMVWDQIARRIFGSNQVTNRITASIMGKVWGTVIGRILPAGAQISHELIKRALEKLIKKYVFEGGIRVGVGAGTGHSEGAGAAAEREVREQPAWRRQFETSDSDSF